MRTSLTSSGPPLFADVLALLLMLASLLSLQPQHAFAGEQPKGGAQPSSLTSAQIAQAERAQELLVEAGAALVQNDPEKAYAKSHQADLLLKDADVPKLLLLRAHTKGIVAAALHMMGRHGEAIRECTEAVTIVGRAWPRVDDDGRLWGREIRARGEMLLGSTYSQTGDLRNATTHLQTAIKIMDDVPLGGDPLLSSKLLALAALGDVYVKQGLEGGILKQGQFGQALKCYQSALKIVSDLPVDALMASTLKCHCHNGLGVCLLAKRDPVSDEEFMIADKIAFQLRADPEPVTLVELAGMHLVRAQTYAALGSDQDSLRELTRALECLPAVPFDEDMRFLKASILEAKGDSLATSGRSQDEIAVRREILRMLEGLSSDEAKMARAKALHSLGTALSMSGSVTEGRNDLEAAIKELAGVTDSDESRLLRIYVFTASAEIAHWMREQDDSGRFLRSAVDALNRTGDGVPDELWIDAASQVAMAASFLGASEVAESILGDAEQRWEKLEDGLARTELGVRLFLTPIADTSRWLSNPTQAAKIADRLLTFAEDRNLDEAIRTDCRVFAGLAKASSLLGTSPSDALDRLEQILRDLGDSPHDQAMRSQVMGLQALALLSVKDRQDEGAVAMVAATRATWQWVCANLAALSDGQKQSLLARTLADPDMVYSIAFGGSRQAQVAGLEMALLHKSLFAELTRREQSGFLSLADEGWKQKWREYQVARSRIAMIISSEAAPGAARSTTMAAVSDVQRLEKELRETNAAFDKSLRVEVPSVSTVSSKLHPGETLIEYVRFRTLGPKSVPVSHYGAFILFSDGRVLAIDLGPALQIEDAIRTAETEIDDAIMRQDFNEKRAFVKLSRVRELIWDPVAAPLGGVKRTFIAPDGSICRLPLEGLPTARDAGGEVQYLVETKEFVYLGTGRQLCERSDRAHNLEFARATLMGDPDFAAPAQRRSEAVQRVLAASKQRGEAFGIYEAAQDDFVSQEDDEPYGRRPQTGELVVQIARRLNEARPDCALALTGAFADKAMIERLGASDLIVVATHGEVSRLDSSPSVERDKASVLDDPLLRCRLALAGASVVHDAGEKNEHSGVFVTGYEIATLDLSRSQLVVVVACESGRSGEEDRGEGVHAFPRAFWIAGARSVVAARWKIEAGRSVQQVLQFLDVTDAQGRSLYGSFRQSQLEILAKSRKAGESHPAHWAGLTYFGDPGD